MRTVLVTGGAGFFGGVLKRRILDSGNRCISVDICPDEDEHANLLKKQIDIRDSAQLNQVFSSERIDGVVHCAAMLAHAAEDHNQLWSGNVEGTRNVTEAMRRHGVRQLVFTSTNCLWGKSLRRPLLKTIYPTPLRSTGAQSSRRSRSFMNTAI